MKIVGHLKTTLLDYPGKVATTIFLNGCNFRCGYCHNSNFVLNGNNDEYDVNDILKYLEKRKNVLEGICISGGEPTFDDGLGLFRLCESIKELGYSIKLDTNGTNILLLETLIDKKLIDYVAMDIKNDIKNYKLVTNNLTDWNKYSIGETVKLLIYTHPVEYEFRTTVARELHTEENIENISRWLHGADKYFIQNYNDSPNVMIKDKYTPHTKEQLNIFKDIANKFINHVEIRGGV